MHHWSLIKMVHDLGCKLYLDLPQSEVERIQKDYHSPNQRKEAYLDLYVHQHPCSLWTNINVILRNAYLHQQANLVENTHVKGTADTLQ